MTVTRHTITAVRSGTHPTIGDWDIDYEITYTVSPGVGPEPAEIVFVSVSPDAGDHGSFTDIAQKWLVQWAEEWLDEHFDRALELAEKESA